MLLAFQLMPVLRSVFVDNSAKGFVPARKTVTKQRNEQQNVEKQSCLGKEGIEGKREEVRKSYKSVKNEIIAMASPLTM